MNIIESSTKLGTLEEEEIGHFRNSSPIDTERPISGIEETEKEKWAMKSYMCSLPTRADMAHYVNRLVTSYKEELKELKTSVQNNQEKNKYDRYEW